jgi:lambda family phage tail tape measure protein
MADAAQLKLQVGLDLTFFRQQLAQLGTVAVGYQMPINIKFDRESIQKELARLSKLKTVISINDSQVTAATDRVDSLNKAIVALRNAAKNPIIVETKYKATGDVPGARTKAKSAVNTAVKGQSLVDNASRTELQSLYKFAKESNLQFEKLQRGAASKTEELRRVLGPAFSNVGSDILAGIKSGLADANSALSKIAAGMGATLIGKTKAVFGIASPSKVFKAIGENIVDGLEIGFIDGLKDFKNKSVDEIRKIVALLKLELAKISGVSMAPAMTRSAGGRGSQGYMSPIGPLPHGSREPWAFSEGRYQPFMTQPGQMRGASASRAGGPSIMGTISSPSMFGAGFPALPSAGMTTGGSSYRQAQLQSRVAAAYARSAAREASVLGEGQMYASVSGRVPLGNTAPRLPAGNRGGALALRDTGAQTPLSLDYYKNAFKYSEALKVADASMRNFSASQIPFIGGLRSAAGELGQATKQVLLYGTAYRALAAITSMPGQILNAAKSQQQYTNGLKVATEETGTFAKELLFVDNVQRAFGLNLETTRTGFTRLYASMAPTGFDSGSIEKLFTGISAATAALQLTPDKAERVIYAFGQMASKGQIMSEELKGQLGDVLPGALAIFAKSAGMSVKEFSKAMEDGEFIGNRFREVFAKVSDELMNRFGTGAQAAGKSLQGLLNTVGGDFQRTLESFAPMANAAAQATLGPLSGMLKQVSTAAQLAMGEQERVKKQLEDSQKDVSALKVGGASVKEIKAAEQNVAALAAKYELLNDAAKDPAIAQQVQNIQSFTEQIGKAGTFTMNLAGSIGGALAPVLSLLGSNFTTVIGLVTSFYVGFQTARLAAMALMGVLLAYRTISAILGFGPATLSANSLAGAFRGLGVAATGAQVQLVQTRLALMALVGSTVLGVVVGGLMLMASAFATVGNKAKEAADKAKQSMDSMRDAALQGNTSLITMQSATAAQQIKDLQAVQKNILAGKTEVEKFKNAITTTFIPSQSQIQLAKIFDVTLPLKASREQIEQLFGDAIKAQQAIRKNAAILTPISKKREDAIGLNKPTPDPLTEDEDTKKKQNLESYYSLQDTLAKNAANFAAAQTEEEFSRRIELLELYYDIQEARANAYQKDAIRFEREMVMIEAKRQEARLKAQLDVQRAQSSVAGGAPGSGAGGTGAIFGDTGRTFNAKGFVHGHFQNQNREALVQDTVETVMALLSKGVSPELGSGARFTSGMNAKQVEALVRQGVGSHKKYASGASAVDIFMPKGTQVPVPVSGIQNLGGAAGVTGSLARGSQLMHLDAASTMIAPTGGTVPQKVTGNEKRDAVAAQSTLQASIAKTATNRRADAKAAQEQIVAFEKYRAAAFPTTEQDMQNKLLAKRNELFRGGMTEERIDQEVKLYENQERGAAGLAAINRLQAKKIITEPQAIALTKELNKDIANQNNLLQQNAILTGQSKFDQAMKGLRDQIDMAKAFTPEAEMRTRLQQQGYAGAQLETLFETEKTTTKAEQLKTQMQGVASTIGDAFSTAFQGIINGSMSAQDALAGFFQSVGQNFVKMAMDIIAKQMTMIVLGFLMKALGLAPKGGGGLSDLNAPQSINNPLGIPAAANGAIFSGGIAKFATGGIVNGPTLFPFADGGAMQMGLMGEAGPEAIMPLQRGSDGSLGVRAAMGGNGMGGSSSPVLNMSFETSTINGVEYVSRDQLEAAMAQTRRQASRDGANKGMAMTLDKIQQSPQTRRRIGM